MRSSRAITIFIFIVLLAAGLAWRSWPQPPPAAATPPKPSVPAAPKVAEAPSPKPPVMSAVEAPHLAPVVPSNVATPDPAFKNAADQEQQLRARLAQSQAQVVGGNTRTTPGGATIVSNTAQFSPSADDLANATDFGDVYLTNGVAQQMTLADGSPVTVTALLQPDGSMQMRFEIERRDATGKALGRSMMTTIGKPGQSMSFRTMGGPSGIPSIKITPHVN